MPEYEVPSKDKGTRLDAWLFGHDPAHSRSRWQALIREHQVRVDGVPRKPGYLLRGGELIRCTVPEAAPVDLAPEAIDLDVLFEDADLIAVNKPAGLVVHPAPGHAGGTLVNALLYHCADLKGVGGERRPGIVHRLDKDTSGVLVAAKHETAMRALAAQFKNREVGKEYLAIAWGHPSPSSGTVETLIGRSTRDRQRMSTQPRHGRRAVTHFQVERDLGPASLVRVRIETGRTHQIRVHLAHLGHGVVGDPKYGRGKKGLTAPVTRQMLHAEKLEITHPATGERLSLVAPLPDDMRKLIQNLVEEG